MVQRTFIESYMLKGSLPPRKYIADLERSSRILKGLSHRSVTVNKGHFHRASRTSLTYVFSDDLLLQEDLVQMVPMVNETNAMAEELGKPVRLNA